MKATLLLAALGWPTLALAQSAAAPTGYLGAGVSVYNESLFRSSPYLSTPSTAVGPVLTVGWQLTSRLAAQLSPALHRGSSTTSYASYQSIGGQAGGTTINRDFTRTLLVVPLQLRVTFTGTASRLQLDGLVGAAWLHEGGSFAYNETDDATGSVLRRGSSDYSDDVALLTLGPAVRYGLGPRLALALALPVQYNLRQFDYYGPGFGDHLSWQPQLSAYYALGCR